MRFRAWDVRRIVLSKMVFVTALKTLIIKSLRLCNDAITFGGRDAHTERHVGSRMGFFIVFERGLPRWGEGFMHGPVSVVCLCLTWEGLNISEIVGGAVQQQEARCWSDQDNEKLGVYHESRLIDHAYRLTVL